MARALKFSTVFGATSGQSRTTIVPAPVLITATSLVALRPASLLVFPSAPAFLSSAARQPIAHPKLIKTAPARKTFFIAAETFLDDSLSEMFSERWLLI